MFKGLKVVLVFTMFKWFKTRFSHKVEVEQRADYLFLFLCWPHTYAFLRGLLLNCMYCLLQLVIKLLVLILLNDMLHLRMPTMARGH